MKTPLNEEEKLGLVSAIAEMIKLVEAINALTNEDIIDVLEEFSTQLKTDPIYWLIFSVIERLRSLPENTVEIKEDKIIERVYGLFNSGSLVFNTDSSMRFDPVGKGKKRLPGELEIRGHDNFGSVTLEPGEGTIIKRTSEEDTLDEERELVSKVDSVVSSKYTPILIDPDLYVRVEFSNRKFW